MKVLMINSVCGTGSTGRICTDIADMLIAQGHECKIAYGRGSVSEKYKNISHKIGSDFDVKMHALAARLFDCSGFCSKAVTRKFVEWIKDYNPDVIHLHNIHGYFLNVEILFDYLKTCGKKIVWTLHDCWAYTGHCSHYTYVKCFKWQEKCFKCPQKKQYPKSVLFSFAKRNFERKKRAFTGVKNMQLVTPSKWLKAEVENSFLKDYPITVINNGIDLNVFKPTPSDFREKNGLTDKVIILGVANVWEQRKGFGDFIKLSEIIDDKYRIVLIGLSDKQLKRLPKNVIGIKRTDSLTELAEIYTAADVLFNPSVEETFGMTVVEAMACGTPAIVYNATALPELSVYGARICETNNIYEMLYIITNLTRISQNEKIRVFSKKDEFWDCMRLYERE